jgi:hypothetical protein
LWLAVCWGIGFVFVDRFMLYITTKADIAFLKEFKEKVETLWALEARVGEHFKPSAFIMGNDYRQAVLDKATSSKEGKRLREELAKGIPRAIQIAYKNHVTIDVKSLPAPAVGGAIIPVNIFTAILKDTSYDGVDNNWIEDKINETIGRAELRARVELFNLFNPLYWLYSILVFVVRIPFHLVSVSGFNVSKVEDHFIGKLFKLAEVGIIVYILVKLGIEKTDMIDFLKSIVK